MKFSQQAANSLGLNAQHMLFVLDDVGAKRCEKRSDVLCDPGCRHDGDDNGTCFVCKPKPKPNGLVRFLNGIKIFMSYMFAQTGGSCEDANMKLCDANNSEDTTAKEEQREIFEQVRLLSLDGGGVRGILLAIALLYFEQHSNKKIQELFNWVSFFYLTNV